MNSKLVFVGVAVVCVVGLAVPVVAQDVPKQRPPIIDMHLHALPAKGWPGGPSFLCPGSDSAAYDPSAKWDPDHVWESCPNPLYPVTSDEELLRETFAVNGSLQRGLGGYQRSARVCATLPPSCSEALVATLGTPDSLRELNRKGELAVLGEIGPPVEGIERLEPYFALAEELDIPLAFHLLTEIPSSALCVTSEKSALKGTSLNSKCF